MKDSQEVPSPHTLWMYWNRNDVIEFFSDARTAAQATTARGRTSHGAEEQGEEVP
jgi:hypothetical protein